MQVFFVDSDPTLAAQALCNKHVVKQVLESAQLLCTTQHIFNSDPRPSIYSDIKFYKKTHFNHPCAVWCRQSLANYNWLCLHALALCQEYTYRYGKQHKSANIITLCALFPPEDMLKLPFVFTQPAQAMPDEYKDDDPVVAYRRYYTECKRNTIDMRWTKRQPPTWWEH